MTEAIHPVLLHSCCAPCSSAILASLTQNGYAPTVFYFNPNIFPAQEYLTRKNECQQYCRKLGIPFVDGDYDHALWREAVKGLEHEPERGLRCRACFGVRMLATAKCAQRLGIESFTTTLAGSRWKRGLQQRRGELLAQEGFYNQLWCGCEFSMGHLTMRAPEELPSYVRDFVKQLGSAKNKDETLPASPSPSPSPVQSPIVPPNHPNV